KIHLTLSFSNFCFSLFVCHFDDPLHKAALLTPPQNITILSTNMKHFLIWSPVPEIAPGEVVKYSVEFQGEYERDYANDSWIPIAECTGVSVTQCDITEDISATVPYNLRVRASTGTQASLWATLNGFFNRVTTSLIPPMLTVTTDGYHLLAELEHLGPAFEFWIFYWKKVVRESTTTVHLKTMEAGAEYCVKAQTFVEAINRSSNFSEVQCVKSEGENKGDKSCALFPRFEGSMRQNVTTSLNYLQITFSREKRQNMLQSPFQTWLLFSYLVPLRKHKNKWKTLRPGVSN
uniref:Interleukin 20 receptor subunit beta n=1 Tax=Pseudonaja textilis TaxID=8673 RepID=A0A670YXQ8_PSETE